MIYTWYIHVICEPDTNEIWMGTRWEPDGKIWILRSVLLKNVKNKLEVQKGEFQKKTGKIDSWLFYKNKILFLNCKENCDFFDL